MNVEYRNLTIQDYDDIIAIWQRAVLEHRPAGRDSRNHIAEEIERSPELFIGAAVDGKLVGTIIGTFDGRRGCVNRLAVLPEYRGLGIAAQLIEICEHRLKQAGSLVTFALIETENIPSLTLFQKRGFHLHEGIKYLSKRDDPDV